MTCQNVFERRAAVDAVRAAELAVGNQEPIVSKGWYIKTVKSLRPVSKKERAIDESWLSKTIDTFLVGPSLLLAGLKILAGRLGNVAMVAGVLVALVWVTGGALSLGLVPPAILMAFPLVFFGLPSRVILAGVTDENIDRVANGLQRRSSASAELTRLKAGVELIRKMTFERLARVTVVLGLGWGALFWYAGAHVLAVGLAAPERTNGIGYTVMGALILFAAVTLASAYAAAVRASHLTLDFALLEVERRLAVGALRVESRRPICARTRDLRLAEMNRRSQMRS